MQSLEHAPFSLVGVIIGRGQGSRVVSFSREHGSSGGTIVPAHGTAAGRWLQLLQLDDIERDIVLMLVRDNCEAPLLDALNDAFRFAERNTGIAFSLPVSHALGTLRLQFDTKSSCPPSADGEYAYAAIFTIVDHARYEDAIDILRAAGAPGGTYIHAFGVPDPARLIFNVPAATEKVMLLSIAPRNKAAGLVSALAEGLSVEEPQQGLVYTVPVQHVRGIAVQSEDMR